MLGHLLLLQNTGHLVALGLATGVAPQLKDCQKRRRTTTVRISPTRAREIRAREKRNGCEVMGTYAVLGKLQSTLLLAELQQLWKRTFMLVNTK